MIKKYKKTLILSSLVTLLPILIGLLLWDRFPEKMVTHWGITGEADGWSSVPFAVFFPPLLMLAVQWLCVWFTGKDPGNQNRNRKVQSLVLWIIPIISNLSSYLMYALALGMELAVDKIMMVPLGLLFAAIGNYLPKTKMNGTIGIKVPWAYSSDTNWNATHRFGGKCWMIGGIIMALSSFLPGAVGVWIMVIVMTGMCVAPIVYSYRFYQKEKASGKAVNAGYSSTDKKVLKGTAVFLAILTIFVLYVLFAGEIEYHFREDYLFIDTNMYADHVVYYDDIQSVQLRDGNVSGARVGGYGSFRLLMGYFRNDEFGTYIRYTYTSPETCVILTGKDKTIVLSSETAEETQAIYQELLVRTGK